jgi:hypothetical protein
VQLHVLAAPHAHADLQAVESIEPTHPLVIHAPAFPPEQDPEAPVPEAWPGVSEIANPLAQRGLNARLAAPIPRGATELREATGPHATDLERHLKPPGELPTAHRTQAFSQGLGRVLVEREIGDESLQPIVFVFELPQARSSLAQVRVLFFRRRRWLR